MWEQGGGVKFENYRKYKNNIVSLCHIRFIGTKIFFHICFKLFFLIKDVKCHSKNGIPLSHFTSHFSPLLSGIITIMTLVSVLSGYLSAVLHTLWGMGSHQSPSE
jgi:hypothetical protein